MAQTKIISSLAALLLFCTSAFAQDFSWEYVPMDGSRVGATIPTTDNIDKAIGTVRGRRFIAPNGKVYRGGSAPAVASLMIDAQASMAEVKEYIGNCPEGMVRRKPESELANMLVDRLMVAVEAETGRKVDVGLLNFGGIRCDMPKGTVIMDDILSMLPFKNYICYVAIKGADLQYLIDHMAAEKMQELGGMEVVVKDHKVTKALVGGKPIEMDRIYGLATIDFLLTGGDNIFAARNAVELVQTEILMRDAILPYLRALAAEGKPIEYHCDGRVRYED